MEKFEEKGEDIKRALVENEDLKESLEVALTVIQSQERRIGVLA